MQKAFKDAYGFDYPLSCVVVSESFANDRPAEFKKMLEDIKVSVAWVVANPAKAALVAEERLSMEKGATEAAIPRCNFEYLDGLKAREAALAFYKKVINVSPAMIGGKLPDEAFYISK
jgi:NitT/TauT family transport system substrate-binding protein